MGGRGFGMRDISFDIFDYGEKVCSITVKGNAVTIINYTDSIALRPFGVREKLTVQDVEDFLEERCFPRARADVRRMLDRLGLDVYDPLEICLKTKGRMYHSEMYLVFQ